LTVLVDSDTRPVLVTSAGELGSRSGGILAALGSGAVVRIDYTQQHRTAALLVGPADIPRVLDFLGVDPATLPAPGTVADAV
jgi:hypothetical protein